MNRKSIGVGFLGLGTVGSGVQKILQMNREQVTRRAGAEFEVKKILVSDLHKKREVDVNSDLYTSDAEEVLCHPEIDVIIEVMGGVDEAKRYVKEALRNKKYVITANKDLMATYGADLMLLAGEQRRNIYYEASVGGGIPLIRPLKHSLGGNRISRIIGIINGTTNYILSKMSLENMDFETALAEAQEKGFAEKDPSNDLEGIDAGYKLCILTGLAFNSRVSFEDLHVEGINGISKRDIFYARELGFTLKLLAIGEEIDGSLATRVHPALIPSTHPLAGVLYENNALYVVGNAVGEVMFFGPGAGSLPTGSSIVADLIDVAHEMRCQDDNSVMELHFQDKKIMDIERLYSAFFLRLQAKDQPGVFASLATTFGDESVSLDMIIQKSSLEGQAEIVLVTHEVEEQSFNRALDRIRGFAYIRKINSIFRVIKD